MAIAVQHDSTQQACRAIMALLFDWGENQPDLMRYLLQVQHREFMPQEKPLYVSRPFTQMRDRVQTGMADGEIRRMDPLVAASCLFGGPLRMIGLRLDGLLPRPLPEYLDQVWSTSWRSVAR